MAKAVKKSGGKGKAERFNVARFVFDKIVEGLKNGEVMWHKPWVERQLPQNAVTKRPYHGFNAFFLNFISQTQGYKTSRYLTFNQCKALGGHVRKGEHSAMVVWADMLHPYKRDENGEIVKGEDGKSLRDMKKVFFCDRYFSVFNIDQCEGLPDRLFEVESFATEPIEEAAKIVKGYKGCPPIREGYDHCAYVPSRDRIEMPFINQFERADEYYSALFHEMIHSTGAKKRLDRDLSGIMGTPSYAFEELVAEIGAAILCNSCGITTTIENTTAYCQSWLKRIEEGEISDKKMLAAFNRAWKAANHILGVKEKGGESDGDAADAAPAETNDADTNNGGDGAEVRHAA